MIGIEELQSFPELDSFFFPAGIPIAPPERLPGPMEGRVEFDDLFELRYRLGVEAVLHIVETLIKQVSDLVRLQVLDILEDIRRRIEICFLNILKLQIFHFVNGLRDSVSGG